MDEDFGMIRTYQIKCDDSLHVQEIGLVHGSCAAYKLIRQNAAAALKNLTVLDVCGVYLLLSEGKVYVGEAESILKRIKQHLSKPPFEWREVIAFVGAGGAASDWEKSSIKYMEHELYTRLVKSTAVEVANGNTPRKSKVNLPWVWDAQVLEIETLLPFLGYPKLFPNEGNVKKDPITSGQSPKAERKDIFPYKIGKVVRAVFPYLFEEGLVTGKIVAYLLSDEAIKRFKMRGHAILFRSTGKRNDGLDLRGVRMFYPGLSLKHGGRSYLLSNQFYREALSPLLEWLKELGVPLSKVLTLCREKYGRQEV